MADLSKIELLALLKGAAAAIERDDSFEGRIAYTFGTAPETFEVDAFLRVGNSMGQGGAIVIQPDREPSDPMADPKIRAALEFVEIEMTSGSGSADDLQAESVELLDRGVRIEFYDGTVLWLTPEVERVPDTGEVTT